MQLTLSDMQGKTIKEIPLRYQIGTEKINVTDLQKGVYILNFGNRLYSTKVSIK